jgi:UDP-N-acetylglucosamine--N-acetylmuramyl-(pentapeptide) pyrophosphoryl-undecaprenol N-acetylglucosamine transferase
MRVLVAGGGTAGHVFPALALARELTDAHGAEVRFAGTPTGQEARLVPAAGFAFEPVEARPLRRELSVETLRAPVTLIRSISRCAPLVAAADVVVGMGGYVSVPVGLAAARAKRPLVLHEQNAVPGLANRVLARRARTVALTFAEAAPALPRRTRTIATGNPVREPILAVRDDRDALVAEAREELDLEADRRTVVVFGGSQGALRVNAAAVEAIGPLRDRADLQMLILTGPAHEEAVRTHLGDTGGLVVRVRGFLDRMELAFAAADLVVARAGATTCAEVAVCGLPSILVPYPYATGHHQRANARALERAGAAALVADERLSGDLLASRIRELVDDPARLDSMGQRARSWSRPDAAQALARVVLAAGRAS